MSMRARTKLAVCVLASALGAPANPYETISPRNVFNLVPPKQDVSKPGDVFKPSAEFKLNGIAGFGSHKWVLLSKSEPGKPPRHFMMREGEQTDGFEIVAIDEIAAIAKLRSEGELLELKLATNSLPKIDLVTQRFVNEHTRAHELHQRLEAVRIARERAEADRMQRIQGETQPPPLSPAEQAVLESQR